MLFAMAMTNSEENEECVKKLALIDVSRAYLNAPATRKVFTKLPEADSEEGMCGRPRKSIYETRDAAKSWGGVYQRTMTEFGLQA